MDLRSIGVGFILSNSRMDPSVRFFSFLSHIIYIAYMNLPFYCPSKRLVSMSTYQRMSYRRQRNNMRTVKGPIFHEQIKLYRFTNKVFSKGKEKNLPQPIIRNGIIRIRTLLQRHNNKSPRGKRHKNNHGRIKISYKAFPSKPSGYQLRTTTDAYNSITHYRPRGGLIPSFARIIRPALLHPSRKGTLFSLSCPSWFL